MYAVVLERCSCLILARIGPGLAGVCDLLFTVVHTGVCVSREDISTLLFTVAFSLYK